MTTLNFDASKVAPASPMEPVPSGWYIAMISKSEKKPTSSGDGVLLSLELTIVEPVEFKGRKLWDRLNIENPNPIAQQIALETLSAICHATGIIQVAEASQLHDRPMQVKASLVPAGPGANGVYYEAKNEVKGYKAVSGTSGAIAPAPIPQSAVPPAAAAPAPPPPAPVVAEVPPPPPAVFPPSDWLAHPTAAGYFYRGQECLSEAQLRAKIAAEPPVTGQQVQPAWANAPVAAPAPAPIAAPAPAPVAAPAPAPVAASAPPWATPK